MSIVYRIHYVYNQLEVDNMKICWWIGWFLCRVVAAEKIWKSEAIVHLDEINCLKKTYKYIWIF